MADAPGPGLLEKLKGAGSRQSDVVADEQQQQLLLLFEKRNQLKREFGRTLDEYERLKAAHEALSEKHAVYATRLNGLEAMLVDPQRGQNAIVYYRLVTLRNGCRALLEQRHAELIARFEQLEKQKLLDAFRANAAEQQRQLEQKFAQLDSIYQEMAENLKALQDRLKRSDRLWHYFRRRALAADVATAESQVAPVVAQRDECLAELERVRDREAPPFKGLSVAAKREINLQLIALAQYLVVHFSENDIAAMAHATQKKEPGESHYGTPQECLAMEKPLRDAIAKLKADDKRADRLKRRSDHLRQQLQFAGNADTLPEPQTLNRIALSVGGSQAIDSVRGDLLINVLEQGYWGLDEVVISK